MQVETRTKHRLTRTDRQRIKEHAYTVGVPWSTVEELSQLLGYPVDNLPSRNVRFLMKAITTEAVNIYKEDKRREAQRKKEEEEERRRQEAERERVRAIRAAKKRPTNRAKKRAKYERLRKSWK